MADLKRKRSTSPNAVDDIATKKAKTKTPYTSTRKKAPGFSNKIFNETSYYIRNGLRFVTPYYFTFESFAKGRWVGRTVFDVFSNEFQSEQPSYYKKAIKAGKITAGGVVANIDTIIERNMLICHRIHRHEPPVAYTPLKFIHQDDQVVIIDKPSSIPVHPCGRYRHNTIVFILAKDYNIRHLHTIHRLDRLTSGILMFSKSLFKAQQMEEQIRNKTVTKTYLARVKGEFPKDRVDCNEPIVVVSHKLGVCHVDPSGKACFTSFIRLHFDGNTSLVECTPKTGRMHQIRVHLQWLGHPILNDPLYNHPAWGPERGQRGQGYNSMDEVLSKLIESRFMDDVVNNETVKSGEESSQKVTAISESNSQGSGSGYNTGDNGSGDNTGAKPADIVTKSEDDNSPNDTGSGNIGGSNTTGSVTELNPEIMQIDVTYKNVSNDQTVTDSCNNNCNELSRDTPPDVTSISSDTPPDVASISSDTPPIVASISSDTPPIVASISSDRPPNVTSISSDMPPNVASISSDTPPIVASITSGMPPNVASIGFHKDPDCTECTLSRADPTPNDLIMCLHALKYSGQGWEYSTEPPFWADEHWVYNKKSNSY